MDVVYDFKVGWSVGVASTTCNNMDTAIWCYMSFTCIYIPYMYIHVQMYIYIYM